VSKFKKQTIQDQSFVFDCFLRFGQYASCPAVGLTFATEVQSRILNIARIANLPYGQSQLYLKSAFIKRKALIKKMKKN